MSPVAPIAHLLAIAAGVWGGFWVMDRVTPDLPSEDEAPGISATAVPEEVAGDAPESLLHASQLAPALDQLDEQLAAGEGIGLLRIEPGRLEVDGTDAEEAFEPADVGPATPQRIVDAIAAERPVVGLGQIRYMELVATAEGPRWYVQLVSDDPRIDPPWTYGAPLAGPPPLEVGGAPPVPPAE